MSGDALEELEEAIAEAERQEIPEADTNAAWERHAVPRPQGRVVQRV